MSWLIEDDTDPGFYLEPTLRGDHLVWTDELTRAARWDSPADAAPTRQTLESLGYSCSLCSLESATARARSAAPAEKLIASEQSEATEAGAPAAQRGVRRPGRSGRERHAPPAGAGELELPPEPGDLGDSVGGHSAQGRETRASRPTPRGRSCVICGEALPKKAQKACSQRCSDEHRRRSRFDRETERRRAARAGVSP